MKWLKKFSTEADYQSYISGSSVYYPNISLVESEYEIHMTDVGEVITPHDYVEIAGVKWATMNIGATAVTDYGKYFAWGDVSGYTAEQIGSGTGQKYFGWDDYVYGNGTSNPGATGMTKYNKTDGLTTLQLSDDGVRGAWGSVWRMPTRAEFVALGNATASAWTTDYMGSGVKGMIVTDKTDSSKQLFFPAAGYADYGSRYNVGSMGYYWSSSLYSNVLSGYILFFNSGTVYWQYNNYRRYGFCLRGILDE